MFTQKQISNVTKALAQNKDAKKKNKINKSVVTKTSVAFLDVFK